MYRILYIFFIFVKISYAQVYPITGKVFSEGYPLPGASVIISGTKIGTITNQSGYFIINVSKVKNPKIIITVKYNKNFSQKISYSRKNIGSIEYQFNDQLNEVVISGTLRQVSKLKSTIQVELYTDEFFRATPTLYF